MRLAAASSFPPLLDGMIGSGLAITERVNVVRYGPRERGQYSYGSAHEA